MFLALLASGLILNAGAETKNLNETLLSTDNAYNPIPSPDGRYIAYVRTGWGRPGGSGGFGRSNLVSELIVIDENGVAVTAMPLTEMFLGGWTPDGNDVVCFRDWEYALVSKDGKRVMKHSKRSEQAPSNRMGGIFAISRGDRLEPTYRRLSWSD